MKIWLRIYSSKFCGGSTPSPVVPQLNKSPNPSLSHPLQSTHPKPPTHHHQLSKKRLPENIRWDNTFIYFFYLFLFFYSVYVFGYGYSCRLNETFYHLIVLGRINCQIWTVPSWILLLCDPMIQIASRGDQAHIIVRILCSLDAIRPQCAYE